ncbi:MAG: cupin domain-containing protein [Deltaproteobacteria bacterium]|nr:MAG: cupin domain-containing protein [Deltaproteobacteria bacterium]
MDTNTMTPNTVAVIPLDVAPRFAGPADQFTGAVQVESLFYADLAGTNGGGMVRFEPGARTAWHTHPRGQTLIVTAGEGWIQQEGEARQTFRAGDVVRIPPNVRHWHGASADTAMSHIAIAEFVDGESVTWMELVSDEAYLGE